MATADLNAGRVGGDQCQADAELFFIAQQVVPVVRADTLPSSAVDALNTVSGKLSTSDLTFLDQLMSGPDAVSAQDAAAFWVQEGTE
mgnify:CR=1 FL=1